MSLTDISDIYNDCSVLPYGYNVGDMLNMPSFMVGSSWPTEGNGYTEQASNIFARNDSYSQSVLGLYFSKILPSKITGKKYERSPSLRILALAVEFYGNGSWTQKLGTSVIIC